MYKFLFGGVGPKPSELPSVREMRLAEALATLVVENHQHGCPVGPASHNARRTMKDLRETFPFRFSPDLESRLDLVCI